ncbi:MAG: hypothetical protein IJH37_12210 [Clostridia bacterium]|nr:hypothetical protein [Clostridia bacterium]
MTGAVKDIQYVLTGILHVLYQYSGGAVLLAFLAVVMYSYAQKYGRKRTIRLWLRCFKHSSTFRSAFFMLIAVSMLLYKTVLCRYFTTSPLALVIGHWRIMNAKGALFTEPLENGILYIFIACFASGIKRRSDNGEASAQRKTITALYISPLVLELVQVFMSTGRFQVSDIAYSWAGITVGLSAWYIKDSCKRKIVNHDL